MPRSIPLPKQLKYLKPFRDLLAKLEPEEINESMDVSQLHKLLRQRIEGLSETEARKILEEDGSAFEVWLKAPKNREDGLYFLEAYLSVAPGLIEFINAEPKAAKTKPRVQMEIPKGARARAMQHGVLKVSLRGQVLFVVPLSKEDAKMYESSFGPRPTVKFGSVSGFRVCSDGGIKHILEVPGGIVHVSLLDSAVELDQSLFTEHLTSLRIVQEKV